MRCTTRSGANIGRRKKETTDRSEADYDRPPKKVRLLLKHLLLVHHNSIVLLGKDGRATPPPESPLLFSLIAGHSRFANQNTSKYGCFLAIRPRRNAGQNPTGHHRNQPPGASGKETKPRDAVSVSSRCGSRRATSAPSLGESTQTYPHFENARGGCAEDWLAFV